MARRLKRGFGIATRYANAANCLQTLMKGSPSARSLDDSDALHDEELALSEPFNPTFTYPIFGEHEKIFGYKGLSINVREHRIPHKPMLKVSALLRVREPEAAPRDHLR